MKDVTTGLRGFVPLTQLGYELAANMFSLVSASEKQWRAAHPGEPIVSTMMTCVCRLVTQRV